MVYGSVCSSVRLYIRELIPRSYSLVEIEDIGPLQHIAAILTVQNLDKDLLIPCYKQSIYEGYYSFGAAEQLKKYYKIPFVSPSFNTFLVVWRKTHFVWISNIPRMKWILIYCTFPAPLKSFYNFTTLALRNKQSYVCI